MWDKAVYILLVFITFVFKDNLTTKLIYFYKFFVLYFFMIFNTLILIPVFAWNGKTVKNTIILGDVCRNVTKLLGVTWHLRNPEIVSEDRGAVIVINHQSTLDLLALCCYWRAWMNATCVVKKEMFYMGPIGLTLWLGDTIFVDRRKPKEAKTHLQTKSNIVLNKKIKIIVFPEGTRNNNTKFLPFKKGAFNVAVGAQVPIIPIVISRYYFINHKLHIFNKGHVIAECLEPISTEGLTMDDVPELMNRVQNKMQEAYNKLSAEVTSTLASDYPLECKSQ